MEQTSQATINPRAQKATVVQISPELRLIVRVLKMELGRSGVADIDVDDERLDVSRRRSKIRSGTSGKKEVKVIERGASIPAPGRGLASAGGQGFSSPIKEATETEEREIRQRNLER
jgi:hypothetical protein